MRLLKILQDKFKSLTILGFGTFSLMQISNLSGEMKDISTTFFKVQYSPFPYESTIYIEPLSNVGVANMFKE